MDAYVYIYIVCYSLMLAPIKEVGIGTRSVIQNHDDVCTCT